MDLDQWIAIEKQAYFEGCQMVSEPLQECLREEVRHRGTPFQQAVWLAIMQIPYGSTITYSELAKRIGHPRAVRAVANACGANPFPIVIPCHRVVAKSGIGGYAFGIDQKRHLLRLEQYLLKNV